MKKNNVFVFPTSSKNNMDKKDVCSEGEVGGTVIDYCEMRGDMVNIILSRVNNLKYPYKMRTKGQEGKEVFGDNGDLSQRVVVEIKMTKERFSRLCNMPYENFCGEAERLIQGVIK